jgi:hypothetical protein
VRTIVTPRSRSLWRSDADRRHSVTRLLTSALPVAVELVSVDVVAPVVLVDPLVAPIVLELELGELELDVELLGEVDEVVLSVDAERDASVEVELPGVVELLVVLDASGVDDEVLELGDVELPYVEPAPVELAPEVELGLVEELP